MDARDARDAAGLDDWQAELREGHGGGVVPAPPVAPDDPFGHALMGQARDQERWQGLVYEDEEEYEAALEQWLAASPVQPAGLARVAPDQRCPVCDKVCETSGQPLSYAPGCYVAYAGRRWDCYELWGRNLSADERRALAAHARLEPRLRLEAPDGSGSFLV